MDIGIQQQFKRLALAAAGGDGKSSHWPNPRIVETIKGCKMVSSVQLVEGHQQSGVFWRFYRENSDKIKSSNCSVSKFNGAWQASIWYNTPHSVDPHSPSSTTVEIINEPCTGGCGEIVEVVPETFGCTRKCSNCRVFKGKFITCKPGGCNEIYIIQRHQKQCALARTVSPIISDESDMRWDIIREWKEWTVTILHSLSILDGTLEARERYIIEHEYNQTFSGILDAIENDPLIVSVGRDLDEEESCYSHDGDSSWDDS